MPEYILLDTVPSNSDRSKTYDIKVNYSTGEISCNCRGWIYYHATRGPCTHVQRYMERRGLRSPIILRQADRVAIPRTPPQTRPVGARPPVQPVPRQRVSLDRDEEVVIGRGAVASRPRPPINNPTPLPPVAPTVAKTPPTTPKPRHIRAIDLD